jgi:DNA repair exonuclease SbcCD ATPase subunit
MDFKYKTQFTFSDIKVSNFNVADGVSRASLQNLLPLIPNSEIDFDQNIDLLGVAFNAAVINKFNKNDDGIDTKTALRIGTLFKHKPTNIEHKKEKVVGHILTAGFSKLGDSELFIPQESELDPFNIALGAVVYKFVNKDFASALEDSTNLDSNLYNKISTSWELGFNEYNIAVGSSNLKEAELITNEKQIKELKGKLKSYGGSGELEDGTKLYRLVVGDVYPLGIGFTATPAADVKGVVVNSMQDKEILESPSAKVFSFKNHFLVKNNSHLENSDVKPEKESMNLETIMSEIKDALLEKKISQEAAANMTATFTEAIKKKDEEYKNELASAKDAAENALKERAELKASMEEVQKQLTEALQRLNEYEVTQKAQQALATFNSRMEEIDSMFELDDEDRQVLAEDIKNLTDDESFASFKNKLSVIWRNKNKEVKTEQEKEIQAKIDAEVEKRISAMNKSSASTSSVEDILDKAKASNATLPNNNHSSSKPSQSLFEKFSEAFKKENIIIS